MSAPFEQQLANVPEIPANLNLLRRVLDNGLHIVDVQFYPEAALMLRGDDFFEDEPEAGENSSSEETDDSDEQADETPGDKNAAANNADGAALDGSADAVTNASDFADDSAHRMTERQLRQLTRLTESATRDLPPLAMSRRRLAGPTDLQTINIRIRPPENDTAWLAPVNLRMHAVIREHADYVIAWIPMLKIEVFARSREKLEPRMRAHIRFALQRNKWKSSLQPLVWLNRCREVSVENSPTTLRIPTPKQVEASEGRRKMKPVLRTVADRLKPKRLTPAFEVNDSVERLRDALLGDERKSVVLVGPSGAGKTAILHEMIRSAKTDTEFWITSGSRLVAGMSGFGMWQERCEKVCAELSRRKAILYAGNLPELIEAGKGGSNSQGIGDFLRNRIDRGQLTLVTECTPQQFTVLERDAPGIVQSFRQITIEEPDAGQGRTILMHVALHAAEQEEAERKQRIRRQRKRDKKRGQNKESAEPSTAEQRARDRIPVNQNPLTLDALEKIDRLHRRYGTYSAYPGRAVRFIRNLVADKLPDTTLDAADVTQAFAKETGLPIVLLDETQSLDADQVRNWFDERVIGQADAVGLTVDLIAAVKAGLTRSDRPIASLLFIGPTGVGKTEMAKAIAEFFFQDRSRMLRIDMSEYADPSSVDRLVGGPGQSEGILTSAVRDQPFGVVLLDEFEKADPRFFDLLLQVLGEGRLTDDAGNLADFRNSIIIMTSNLGVESSSRSGFGFGSDSNMDDVDESDREQLQAHFIREVRQFLRPEMYNRIDRIVPFSALDRETIRRIARRELKLAAQRDGIEYRDVDLDMADNVIDSLVALGHDKRYGARPLKRAIERHLLHPLAEQMIDYSASLPLAAEVRANEENAEKDPFHIHVRGLQKQGKAAFDEQRQSNSRLAEQLSEVRRSVQKLGVCGVTFEARNDVHQIEQAQERCVKKYHRAVAKGRKNIPFPVPDERTTRRLAILADYLKTLDSLTEETVSLEDDVLQSLYRGEAVESDLVRSAIRDVETRFRETLMSAYVLSWGDVETNKISVSIYFEPESLEFARNLFGAYEYARQHSELRANYFAIRNPNGDYSQKLKAGQFYISQIETDPKEIAKFDALKRETWRAMREEVTMLIAEPVDSGGKLRKLMGQADVLGIIMRIRGPLAAPLLQGENGRQELVERKRSNCLVCTSEDDVIKLVPPEGIERRGTLKTHPLRRTWDARTWEITDPIAKDGRWSRTTMPQTLSKLLDDRMLSDALSLLD